MVAQNGTVPGRIAVVFDQGSASPVEISVGLSKVAPLVVVTAPSDYATSMQPLLRGYGEVVALGSVTATASTLRELATAAIVTFSERMLESTAEIAAELDLTYHSAETVELLTHKFAQREGLAKAGITPVRCQILYRPEDWPEAVDHVGLPAVLKPLRGEGSRNTYRVDHAADGLALVNHLLGADGTARAEDGFVLEEFLSGRDESPLGDYVSVECAVVNGRVTPIAATGKLPQLPPFREVGQFWPARLSTEETQGCRDLATQALEGLGLRDGLAHVEIKLTEAGPRIIEVNGRMGGLQADLAWRAAGLDLVELAGRIAMGQQPEVSTPVPGRVFFQYYCPAPTIACRLTGVNGAQRVIATGNLSYRPFVRRGQKLDGGVATTILGVVAGSADDHDTMLAMIRHALAQLRYTFDTTTGPVEILAQDLCNY